MGKTTLLLELERQFDEAAIYMAGDDPDARLPGFWERCWTGAEARAQRSTAVLLLDVRCLDFWRLDDPAPYRAAMNQASSGCRSCPQARRHAPSRK